MAWGRRQFSGGSGWLTKSDRRRVYRGADPARGIISRSAEGLTDVTVSGDLDRGSGRNVTGRNPDRTVGMDQTQGDKGPEVEERQRRAQVSSTAPACLSGYPEGQEKHLPCGKDRVSTARLSLLCGFAANTR